MKKVLVAYHSMGGNTEKVASELASALSVFAELEVNLKKASDVTAEDFLDSDGFAFGTPDYFSYMAGMLKDMFERVFSDAKAAHSEGKPCVCFVTHGGGGKAVNSLERMCTSFKLDHAADILSIQAPVTDEHLAAARELGKSLASKLC
jgi:flavorubredoxin